MKRLILMSVFLSLLISCASNPVYKLSHQNSPFQESNFNTSMNVTLSAKYKDDKLTITVTNDTSDEIDFGREYLLEKNVDNEWKMMVPVNGELAFYDVGIRALPYKKSTYKVVPGRLEKGTYRVIKKDMSVKGSKDDFIKSCTFVVK